MSKIVAIFCRNHSVGSILIRWLGAWGSNWSHVGILDGDYVIEARYPAGVTKTLLSEFQDRYTKLEYVDIECPDAVAAMNYANSRVGRRYDLGAILGFIIREPIASLNRDFCNELLEDALAAGGRSRFRVPTRSVTVEQSYRVL